MRTCVFLAGLLSVTCLVVVLKILDSTSPYLFPEVGHYLTVQPRRDAVGVSGGHLKSDVVDATRVSLSGRLISRNQDWWVLETIVGGEKTSLWIPTHSILFAKISENESLQQVPAAQERLSLDVESFSSELQLDWKEQMNILSDGNPKFVSASVFQPLNTQSQFLISRPNVVRTTRGGFVVDYVLRPLSSASASGNVRVSVGFSSDGKLVSVQAVPPDNNDGIRASTADASHWGQILGIINQRVRESGPVSEALADAMYRSSYAVHRALRIEGSDPAGYQGMTNATPLTQLAKDSPAPAPCRDTTECLIWDTFVAKSSLSHESIDGDLSTISRSEMIGILTDHEGKFICRKQERSFSRTAVDWIPPSY